MLTLHFTYLQPSTWLMSLFGYVFFAFHLPVLAAHHRQTPPSSSRNQTLPNARLCPQLHPAGHSLATSFGCTRQGRRKTSLPLQSVRQQCAGQRQLQNNRRATQVRGYNGMGRRQQWAFSHMARSAFLSPKSLGVQFLISSPTWTSFVESWWSAVRRWRVRRCLQDTSMPCSLSPPSWTH